MTQAKDTTEQKATHTPGPWRWMDYPDGRKLLLSRDRAVIHCPDAPMTCDPADAQLIAAAPELLAALKALLHEAVWDDDSDREAFDAAYAHAETAIAEAEGRA